MYLCKLITQVAGDENVHRKGFSLECDVACGVRV